MGVQGFQDYIEKHCPSAVVPVELQKLARGSLVGGGRQRPPQTPLRLLIDADNCLHRLYGGFYTDWVSGGQWNHMLDKFNKNTGEKADLNPNPMVTCGEIQRIGFQVSKLKFKYYFNKCKIQGLFLFRSIAMCPLYLKTAMDKMHSKAKLQAGKQIL